MSAGSLRQLAAASAIVALVWVVSIPTTPAGTLASWGGRVFQPDRTAPRAGVVIELIAGHEEAGIRSEPTRSDGAFTLDGIPAGRYTLHVETPEGVFVSSEPLELQPGSNAPMALALETRAFDAKQEHGFGGDDASRRTELILAGVVSLFALGIYLLITEDETETSSSLFDPAN